ncbi:hypothetical protein [Vagococcus silagei]|uniref:Uncharacterized protein n=1 Tax=Vagococcus silagei TaxID=2508885 RepID=A0A4S3B5R8_9ENTE|nr:hypothetical protein [Vagococcus silagei]THB62434.1 hypothetical protein ESZ54_01075 [Vagococcus silagei]
MLTNRIKANKEDNISIIKKDDGKNYYIYHNNSIEKLVKLTNNYLSSIKNININEDTTLTKSMDTLAKEQQKLIKRLNESNKNLEKEITI